MASSSSSAFMRSLSSIQQLQQPKFPPSSSSSSISQNLMFPNVAQNPLFSSSKTLKISKSTHQILPTKNHFTTIASSRVQEMHVYEMNELDRGSPVYLPLSKKWFHSLGDLVPFTNKLYTGDLQTRLGITAGLCLLIRKVPIRLFGDRYEVIYSFYLGDYGSITVRGAYLTYEDIWLAVTGGTGVFEGACGQVKLHQVVYPFKIFYTFQLKGIKDLPPELVSKPVKPWFLAKPSRGAKACEAHAVAPNFTH